MAARIRVALAAVGTVLLGLEPTLHPRPLAAAGGLAVLAVTGLLHGADIGRRAVRVEEAVACSAGVLLVTLGNGSVTALTLIWLVSAAVGVVARGGRVGGAGRVFVVLVLASPIARFGFTVDTISLLASGTGLLLAVGRITFETAELLRDPLTGALSRAAFDAQCERLAAHAEPHRPLGVILLGLDDFSTVNKRGGHQAGDTVLIEAAQVVADTLHDDNLLGRVGGDEFAVLVIGKQPFAVADRLLSSLSAVGISASAGVANGPRDGSDARSLLTSAGIALRRSKLQGAGRATSYVGPRLTGMDAGRASAALDRLCAGRGVAIALQPIMDLESGEARAYEALARFDVREASEGPHAWFTLADRLGRREELERTCAAAALTRIGELPESCALAINVSPDLLDDLQLLELIEACPDADRVIIEVTERQAVRAGPRVGAGLERLRERGVAFAVDDVGTGHAGLAQLALVRPDYLKLDRSLVRSLPDAPDRAAFVRALATYVKGSNTVVIAEGIETDSELAAVQAAEVSLGQGFRLGQPTTRMPAAGVAV